MLVKIVQILVVIPSGVAPVFFLAKTVPLRRERLCVWLSVLWAALYYIVRNFILVGNVFFSPVGVLGIIAIAIAFSEPGHRAWTFISSLVYFGGTFIPLLLVTFLSYLVTGLMGRSMDVLMQNSWLSALMSVITFLFMLPFLFLYRKLLLRMMKAALSPVLILLFALIGLSQVFMMIILIDVTNGQFDVNSLSYATPLGLAICLGGDVALFFAVSRIRQTQTLRAAVAQAEQNIELQASYYDKLQKNVLEINQIRHDLVNQLQAAYHLLDMGSSQEARDILDALSENVRERVGVKYCANMVADAVLSEKAEKCAEEGIALDISAELPQHLPIRNAHLCSALSNILDNSIAGAKDSGAEDKRVTLDAHVRGGFLVIRCQNSCQPKPLKPSASAGDPLRRHGLGLEILRTLAGMYEGELKTEQDSGQFTTALMLKL